MKITLDTNALNFHQIFTPKDTEDFEKIIMENNCFVSDAIFSIESIRNSERASVFGKRKMTSRSESTKPNTISISIGMSTPTWDTPTDFEKNIANIIKKLNINMMHGAPRLGFSLKAPEKFSHFYFYKNLEIEELIELSEELQRAETLIASQYPEISRNSAINFGLEQLANERQKNNNIPNDFWTAGYSYLQGSSIKKGKEMLNELSDRILFEQHLGFKNDILCTRDNAVGKPKSIFSEKNKKILSENLGIKFMTPHELLNILRP